MDDIWDAIDGLMAYDSGVDSGIHNESLRQQVRDTLLAMSEDERREWLAKKARHHLLSDKAISQGCGIEDVHELYEWIDNLIWWSPKTEGL